MFVVPKAAELNELEQGGQLYLTFPLSKGSLTNVSSVSSLPNRAMSNMLACYQKVLLY